MSTLAFGIFDDLRRPGMGTCSELDLSSPSERPSSPGARACARACRQRTRAQSAPRGAGYVRVQSPANPANFWISGITAYSACMKIRISE